MARLNDSRIGAFLGEDLAVRVSSRTAASSHAVHGIALFITLEQDISISSSQGPARGRAILVPPETEHVLDSPGQTIGICFDPERLPRLAGFARACGGPYRLEGRVASYVLDAARAHRAELSRPDVLEGLGRDFARRIGENASSVRLDPRVARVVEAVRDGITEVPRLPISDGHLQELFTRDVGVPIRTYRLWRRLLRALVVMSQRDATTAAHAAGFADLAHFSRTCRRMLGYSPTTLRDGI